MPNKSKSMNKKRSKTIRNRKKGGANLAELLAQAAKGGPGGKGGQNPGQGLSKKQRKALGLTGQNPGGQQNPQHIQQQLQKLLKQQTGQQTGQPTGQITPEQMALLTGQHTGKTGKGQPQIYDPNKKINNYIRQGTPIETVRTTGKFTKGETMQRILKKIHKYVKRTHKAVKKKGKYPQVLSDRLRDLYGVIKRVYKTTKKTKPGK